ncbi:MAG: VCBS repeat-containing protein [Blastocatellia bacterium]|nr:VCBS repeat-containing protein [Blastocatellia bacterium]
MHSEPRPTSLANISRILVCLSVFTIIAFGYFGSASTVETAENVAPPARIERAVAPRALIAPSGAVPFDFDGDGKTDIGRWHGASTEYKVWKSGSSEYQTTTIGTSSAKAISGDFDNDNKYDAGTFAAGAWNIKKSSDGNTISTSFGTTGDIPVAGDFGGNGTSDCAVFRPSTNTWWILPDCTGSYSSTSYGSSGDIPVPGDFDGDGTTDRAVYRPTTGYWYANRSSAGSLAVQWGISTDVPMAADFDNDGKDDLVVFRPSSGTWYVLNSQYGFTTYTTQVWGNWYDQPVVGYYDADGIADYAIWRPTTGEWWILKSTGGNLTYSLGVPGDTAIPSAFTKQVGGTATGYELATDRLDPANGTGGTDIYSRNFSWGTSLVNLPGRSGLDAGLGLSYNSLVWIKTGGSMYFDPDSSNVAPGFRLGLPTIEPIYYNDTRSKWAYMMVTPSGKRVEFVETSVDELFITTDSSYTQLVTGTTTAPNVPSEGVTMTVKTTDGTQMTYSWNSGAYRCTRVKDRNGNYIDYTYSAYGKLETMTDTLGRVVNVNYDGYGRISTITQNWNASNGTGSSSPHTYATFTYTTKTVATDWSVPFYGPPNDTAVTVLDKITYADTSWTKFHYNGYLQVSKVENYADDDHLLNHVRTSLDSVTGSQSDVPRFTWTKNYAENSNGNSEVTVTNSVPASATYTIDGVTATGTKIDVGVTGHPDSLFTRYWYHSSGWKKGLPIGTEDCVSSGCTGTDRKRWTSTDWTQDNDSVSYIVNPCVIGSKVGDTSNTKKSEIEYWLYENTTVSVMGLVRESRVYDTDGTTVLKKAYTEYNLASEYFTRNIIGLPAMTLSYGRDEYGLQLVGKTTYAYDEGNFSGTGQTISPTKHDGTNYGSSFIAGRGNVTSIRRWDAVSYTSEAASTVSTIKYNTAGSVISKTTPWYSTYTRTVGISYDDNFNSIVSPATYAYPTSITDPNNQSSTVKYRYDIGANVEATSPAPAGQTYGKTSKRWYDSIGRLEKDSVFVNTAEQFYTRYEYVASGTHSKVYSTITDVSGSTAGPDTADEVLSESFTDGTGRVIKSRSPHTFNTNGTTATYSGVKVEYDLLGRTKKQSVPTEVDGSWNPTGDDSTRGWLWNESEFDWKGRVTRSISSDGSDTLAEYEGCGCAGGEIVTLKGELLTEGRRTQKQYSDILGRNIKVEMLDWSNAVYKTATNTYNGRDQVVRSRIYAGLDTSSDFRETLLTYDGFGRITTEHKPEQDANTNTSYNYFLDDKPQTITDARGAAKHYSYNNLGLIDEISWTVPNNSGISVPATVEFEYDTLGNRIEMTDGHGSVEYEYDSLSKLISEEREFNEWVSQSPTNDNKFKIEYSYGLSGQLKSYKEPYGEIVSYGFHKNGRLKTVNGNRTVENTQIDYITNSAYRAWGAPKSISHSNGFGMTMEFNTRLQASQYQSGAVRLDYEYFNDGRLKSSDTDYDHTGSNFEEYPRFDRSYEYDFLGRLTAAKTGAESHGQTEDDPTERPYRIIRTFNPYGEVSAQERSNYRLQNVDSFAFENGRMTNEVRDKELPGWFIDHKEISHTFDADGRSTTDGEKFDAEGRQEHFDKGPQTNAYSHWFEANYDGDGRIIKTNDRVRYCSPCTTYDDKVYRVNSSVIGETLVELRHKQHVWPSGTTVMRETGVFASGERIAFRMQNNIGTQYYQDHWYLGSTDPSGVDYSQMNYQYQGSAPVSVMDPFGSAVGIENTYPSPEEAPDPYDPYRCDMIDFDEQCGEDELDWQDPANEQADAGSAGRNTCYVDGVEQPNCDQIAHEASIHDDMKVVKDDEFPDAAPSDTGSQSVHQNEDPTDDQDYGDFGEKTFEQDSKGSFAFVAGTVNGSDSIGTVSDLDLRNLTLPDPAPTPPKADVPVYTDEMRDCDSKLAKIFGGKNAVAAGSGFEPPKLFGKGRFAGSLPRASAYRGGPGGHLSNAMHLYYSDENGNNAGEYVGSVFVPSGGVYSGKNPFVSGADSHIWFYARLGSARNVLLTTSHIDSFQKPSGTTKGTTEIGLIGGEGGADIRLNDPNAKQTEGGNIHSHFTLFSNASYNKRTKSWSVGSRLNFFDVFCRK